jgi:hypothetical protein
MKKKILLPVLLLCVSTVLVAQRSSLIYAITAPDKQTNWENIQLLNSKEGVVLQTVFDPSKQKISVTDAVSNTPITRTVNGKPIGPTATTVAAAAFDEAKQRFFYIPLRIPELRWADMRQPSSPRFFTLTSPLLTQLNMDDAANHITRMVIGADGNGYAVTNDGNHLYRFSTGKTPELIDLGNLVDAAGNGQVSVHSQCSSWGGDMVAGTDGLLYLISHRKYVFSIDPATRMATHLGVIKGLPENFNVNGAAVDHEGRVLMSCSFGSQLYYHLDLETLTAQPAYKEDTKRINASDLASGNLAKRPAINRGQYVVDNSPFTEVNQKIAMFPNPVTEHRFQLSFEETGTGIHTIQVMDLSGKIMFNKTVNVSGPGQYEGVELKQTITKGLYMVKVLNQDAKTVYSAKFVVQ